MASNSLGNIFRVTSFGESHGPAVGVVLDGVPAGLPVDLNAIRHQMSRRRPGQSPITTQRQEADEVEILSGVYQDKTLGSPICLMIRNLDQRPADYAPLEDVFRPGHADYTYHAKYGLRDPRGGGRSSARITTGWVAAGAMAETWLKHFTDIGILAWVSSIHHIQAAEYTPVNRNEVDTHSVRCPDPDAAAAMLNAIEQASSTGDSLGGLISCLIRGCPAGLGEPVFDKLNARLGHAMLSLNAVKGVEFGDGFSSARLKGSEMNDAFIPGDHGQVSTSTNHSGGIQGGLANGNDIVMRIAFKPTSTIRQEQDSVNTAGQAIKLSAEGRHDPCVLPRAVPIVEALAAITLLDLYLSHQLARG